MAPFHRRAQQAELEAGEATMRIRRASSPPVVEVAGRVTVDSSPHLRSALLALIGEEISPALVIELSGVSYLDISGIATLLEAAQTAREHATRLRLVGVSGQPRMLAEVVELGQSFRASGSEVECS